MNEHELQHIENIATNVPEYGKVLEVGSFYGRSTWAWAKSVPETATVLCIDTWTGWPITPEGKSTMQGDVPEGPLKTVIDFFLRYTADCPNVSYIQGRSGSELPQQQKKAFDVVFLDGMHTNPELHGDIKAAIPLVKDGGILCGHDFSPNWPDVIQEVREWSAKLGYSIRFAHLSSIWEMTIE